MMGETLMKCLSLRRVIYLFAFIWAVFLGLAGFLYWQGHIQAIVLILVGIIALVAGISYVFGIRIAQKDGFLDGYSRAKDNFDKQKKS